MLEIWKSAPFAFNFMEHYEVKRALTDAPESSRSVPAMAEAIRAGHGVLPWDDIARFGEVDPGTLVRRFLGDVVRVERWRLLCLPPAQLYYRTDSEFEQPSAANLPGGSRGRWFRNSIIDG